MTYPNPRVIPGSGVPEVEQAGPVIIRATVEDMIGTTEDMEISRADWNAMTPEQRRETIDSFGAETMTNQGGYGAGIWDDTAPDSDLLDPEELLGGAAALRADVVTSVVAELAKLRNLVHTYALLGEHFGSAREAMDITERNEAHRALVNGKNNIVASFDRIEHLVRGEQQ